MHSPLPYKDLSVFVPSLLLSLPSTFPEVTKKKTPLTLQRSFSECKHPFFTPKLRTETVNLEAIGTVSVK